jgi:hypothetical protein
LIRNRSKIVKFESHKNKKLIRNRSKVVKFES